jgi:hypothetical protein
MNTRRYSLCLALAAAVWAATVGAAGTDAAGTIKTSQGAVTVEHGGQKIVGSVGTPVFVGDRVHAGVNSYVGITLRDNTLLTGGPESTLLITEFQFKADTHDGNLLVSLLKGSFSVVTGLIAKRSPESVGFKTPAMTLGVRGTEFVVEVNGAAE